MTPEQRKRLAQILGMLGSDHDGEVAVAGRKAHELLKSLGLTWEEAVGGKGAGGGFNFTTATTIRQEAYQQGYREGYQYGFEEAAAKAMALQQETQRKLDEAIKGNVVLAGAPGQMAKFCLESSVRWRENERDFLEDMLSRNQEYLSEKQIKWLEALHNKAKFLNRWQNV